VIRGRVIGEAEIGEVRRVAERHGALSRAHIARELCALWGWERSNGKPKERACREVLSVLEARGLVSLPVRRFCGNRGRRGSGILASSAERVQGSGFTVQGYRTKSVRDRSQPLNL
jgi:hypothetical protein